jgi:hypothetical protein
MIHAGRRGNMSAGADGITENRQIETRNRYESKTTYGTKHPFWD